MSAPIIDFDEASKAWRSNKINKGGGHFVYRCSFLYKTGKMCPKKVLNPHVYACRVHIHRIKKRDISPSIPPPDEYA